MVHLKQNETKTINCSHVKGQPNLSKLRDRHNTSLPFAFSEGAVAFIDLNGHSWTQNLRHLHLLTHNAIRTVVPLFP